MLYEFIENLLKRHRNTAAVLGVLMVSMIYTMLCIKNITLAIGMAVFAAAFYTAVKKIEAVFAAYVIILPFSRVPLFDRFLFGINGLRIQYIVLGFCLLACLLRRRFKNSDNVFSILILMMLALYSAAWIKSVGNATAVFADNPASRLSVMRYLVNHVSWTITALVPMLLMAYFYRQGEDTERAVHTLAISAIMLMGYLLYIFAFKIHNRTDFEFIRTQLGKFTGLHGNDAANYCVLSFPVLLAGVMRKKKLLLLAALPLVAAGTAVSFSRTAYFLVPAGVFLFLLLSGRYKTIPLVALTLITCIYLFIPGMVLERAVTGVGSGDYDELSAGRIEYIWEPVVEELKGKPDIVLWGYGRYGFTNTNAWKQGRVSMVTHAHNMYLDCILDMGIAGLAVFVIFFAYVVSKFIRYASMYRKKQPYHSDLLFGCATAIICYMISGLTGRTFFPTITNVYLWIVTGMGMSVAGYLGKKG